ncbi:hypothetical protein CTI12_AA232880 [Artemisia annua]|uniref:Uncharacterized protein n=1 Tax=Artemisia annua TaxID=35608 RepID=A0A2U1NSY7_ARTAN|nr:hypothetical protein CTI12_AA232880 [Artemisia annua]
MALFDLNEPVMLDPITGDVIDDSITNGVVEESVSAVVVNASDSLDGFVNSVSSSSDGVPVSNGDQVSSSIEVHAARVYTRSLFVRVQKDIIASY